MTRSLILTLLFSATSVTHTEALAVEGPATSSVDLISDLPSGQPVGTPIRWTVRSSSANPTTYRLTIETPGDPAPVMIDYRSANVFDWAPSTAGVYVVRASARNENTGEETQVSSSFEMFSRATDFPMVTLTDHPLVALFSSPPCEARLRMRILYKARGARTPEATPTKPCDGASSMNFYVAGLLELSEYAMRAELLRNESIPVAYGPELSVRTGAIETRLPTRRTPLAPTARSSRAEDMLLQSPAIGTVLAGASSSPTPVVPWASDLSGRVLWYYGGDPAEKPSLLQPVPGGTFLITGAEGDLEGQFLREVDLLGRVVRETSRERVSEQLLAMGQDEIGAFHHDALRLANGHTAVIASVERILQGVQGPLPVDILGDMIVVLDRNWQVAWVWNAFDHLDVSRRATLDEICTRGEPGCSPFFLADVVNDWTHTNAITYSPIDGNLLVSVRNQDWVVKVDFRDGLGSGDVLWRLGPEGDFILDSGDPSPWLSHQHDPRFVDHRHLVVYDNGNTRCATFPDLCFSRAQVYRLDQSNRVATLTLNFNLGSYSFALGSAQPLSNGNFHFNSGTEPGRQGGFVATSDEVTSDGSFAFAQLTEAQVYRSWRLTDLYMTTNTPESLAYAERLFSNGSPTE